MATHKAHRFVGLDKDVWLPDDIKVFIKIITSPRFRSNQTFSGQSMVTWHDTGNLATNANGEWTWANNGRPGGSVGGYNFIWDASGIIQCSPLDEVTWAAGTPTGNKISWHGEQALKTDWEESLRIGAALYGGLIAAMDWTTTEALKQHNYWYGKDCPGQIRKKGQWPKVVAMVEAARVAALRAAGGEAGGEELPGPTYVKPIHVPELAYDTYPPAIVTYDGSDFIFVGDMVAAIRDTPRLQKAFDGADETGPNIKTGEQFPVEWLFKNDDAEWFYLTPWSTRVKYADTKRVADIAEAA